MGVWTYHEKFASLWVLTRFGIENGLSRSRGIRLLGGGGRSFMSSYPRMCIAMIADDGTSHTLDVQVTKESFQR